MTTVTLSAVVSPDEDWFTALCPELDIASQGDSVEDALSNLREAVEGFFEVANDDEVQSRLKKPSLITQFEAVRA